MAGLNLPTYLKGENPSVQTETKKDENAN
jgi:hypothetical protein